ncbi:hypothetical protein BGZ91_010668 [Linnemannia elongata]|nr:hypothetical protein BGZ91_010668 [Linnemannia elongata]
MSAFILRTVESGRYIKTLRPSPIRTINTYSNQQGKDQPTPNYSYLDLHQITPNAPDPLAIPEILTRVGFFLLLWMPHPRRRPAFLDKPLDVLNCMLVSRHWYQVMIPILWHTCLEPRVISVPKKYIRALSTPYQGLGHRGSLARILRPVATSLKSLKLHRVQGVGLMMEDQEGGACKDVVGDSANNSKGVGNIGQRQALARAPLCFPALNHLSYEICWAMSLEFLVRHSPGLEILYFTAGEGTEILHPAAKRYVEQPLICILLQNL